MQKRVLALQDLAGFGRSSLVPVISVISAMGHQCVPVPTAVYSSHLGLPGWHETDLTAAMRPALAQYKALGVTFDAVYAGFLSSAEQIGIVQEAAQLADGGLFVLDPVMGDNGRLYSSMTPALCSRMGDTCARASVITPNTTEAAILLGRDPADAPETEDEAREWTRQLAGRYGAAVVLTGVRLCEGQLTVACFEKGKSTLIRHERLGGYYPGTGDLFAAVLTGGLTRGEGLVESAGRAAGFVRACIAYTEKQHTENLYGVQFESQLYRLLPEQEGTADAPFPCDII